MAVNSKEKLNKLLMTARILKGVGVLRIIFFAYSFISFVFWFLNCLDVDFLYLFEPLFIIPYRFVQIFYQPQGVAADFSLAIIGGISLGIGFILDYIINTHYEKVLDKIDEEQAAIKRAAEEKKKMLRRKKLAAAKNNSPVTPAGKIIKNLKLLFMMSSHVNKIKKLKTDTDMTFQEVYNWKQKVNQKLIERFQYSNPIEKNFYHKLNPYLIYEDFNYADDFIYYIKPTTDSLKSEFRKYGVKVIFCYAFSVIEDLHHKEAELGCMDTILSLNFKEEYIATNRFKQAYNNRDVRKYELELKGEYNLSKNLTISNKQPLYKIENRNIGE